MHQNQYRTVIVGLVAVVVLLLAQLVTTNMRLSRLEKSVESAELASIDALETVKTATGRPSLQLSPQKAQDAPTEVVRR